MLLYSYNLSSFKINSCFFFFYQISSRTHPAKSYNECCTKYLNVKILFTHITFLQFYLFNINMDFLSQIASRTRPWYVFIYKLSLRDYQGGNMYLISIGRVLVILINNRSPSNHMLYVLYKYHFFTNFTAICDFLSGKSIIRYLYLVLNYTPLALKTFYIKFQYLTSTEQLKS